LEQILTIKLADKINTTFFTLAKAIINNDAKQFKNQHQEYSADPIAEIKESLSPLRNKLIAVFIRHKKSLSSNSFIMFGAI
jgi:hypothetical protein